MKNASMLLLCLAATAAADPEAAGALKLTRPDKWTRQEDAANRSTFFLPPEEDASSRVALIVMPPDEVEGAPADWLDAKWKGLLEGRKVVTDGGSGALGEWVHRTARLEDDGGKSWTRLYAVRAGRKIQGAMFVAETKKLFERYAEAVDKSLADATWAGKRAAGPRIKGAWSGVVMRNRYDALSKGYVWMKGTDRFVLFDNGLAARDWPDKGLDSLDFSVDPLAKLDYLGKLEETDKEYVITWEPGSTTTLTKADGKLLEASTHGEFFPMLVVDGSRPEGTFHRPDNFWPNTLVLHAGGTFEEQGCLALLSQLVDGQPQRGKSTYEIRLWTLRLTYEDGVTRTIAYEVTKGTAAKPERIVLNTYGLDRK
ncbi:MAG: hypothetical protein IT452_16350 [Planctomycetia bacterium]|nr:hypothetical protein [Planctomycetia bacterium]